MTRRDKLCLSQQDSVPAWLRTLEPITTCYGDEQDTQAWQGKLFLRGNVHHFIVNDDVVDRGLRGRVRNTPVLIHATTLPGSFHRPPVLQHKTHFKSHINRDTLALMSLTLMTPAVPMAVGQCLYQRDNVSPLLTMDVIEHIEKLIGLIASMRTPLREFLTALFSDAEIAVSFVSSPVSHRHQYAKPGGLLIHSVDVALLAKHLSALHMAAHDVEITTVAALLHDIGKTRTNRVFPSSPVLGQRLSHQSAGLEILAPYLNTLATRWPSGAESLRHTLAWDTTGHRSPVCAGTQLVNICDQLCDQLV